MTTNVGLIQQTKSANALFLLSSSDRSFFPSTVWHALSGCSNYNADTAWSQTSNYTVSLQKSLRLIKESRKEWLGGIKRNPVLDLYGKHSILICIQHSGNILFNISGR